MLYYNDYSAGSICYVLKKTQKEYTDVKVVMEPDPDANFQANNIFYEVHIVVGKTNLECDAY